jgi:hypothetical protein
MKNPTPNPGLAVQLAVHRAVRRDTTRLGVALAGGGAVSPGAVAAYWAETARQLHHHHELEDTIVWPLMGDRLGERVAALLARNAHEHQVMASAMDDFDVTVTTISASDISVACDALGRLNDAIQTHLAHEEADVLPLIEEAFTFDDFAYFQTESAKTNTADDFLPWVLDDAAQTDVDFFTGKLPDAVRNELFENWIPRRTATVEALESNPAVAAAY